MESQIRDWRLLFVVFIIAGVLRLWQLGSVPPSPSLDEVSIGYNAYSIGRTGSDEYGTRLPLLLRAYDDWRPAPYVYLVLPFVMLLGLDPAAVRLPSVFLSFITIFAVYGIGNLIFPVKKYSIQMGNMQFGAGFFGALFLSVSPWHVYLSRLGHEVNLGLMLVTVGMYFIFRAVIAEFNGNSFITGVVILTLSMYAYQSQKLIVPVILVAVALIYARVYRKYIRTAVLAGLVVIALLIPLLGISLQPDALIRLSGTSAFTSENPQYGEDLKNFTEAKESGNIIGQIAYNRRFTPVKIFVSNYSAHLNPAWLFTGGPKENHKVPYTGLMYPWDFLLLIAGVLIMLKSPYSKSTLLFIVWILASPLPAAITTQAPHAMRSFTAVPGLCLLSGLGAVGFLTEFRKRMKLRKISSVITAGLMSFTVVISVAWMAGNYYIIFPQTHSASFQYALSQALEYTIEHEGDYESIIVSNNNALYQSYMFYLFQSRVDPKTYIARGGTKSGGFDKEHSIGKIQFRAVKDNEVFKPGILYVVNPHEVPGHSRLVRTFKEKDGNETIVAAEIL